MTQPPSESEKCSECGHDVGIHRNGKCYNSTCFCENPELYDSKLEQNLKRPPMTAEQEGPRPGTFGEFYKDFAEFQLKTPYQYFKQENGLYSFKSPTVCAIDQTLEKVQETQVVGGYAYEAGYAQGRKSMEAELERVLKEAEDLKIAFGLSKSCVYAIRDQFYKCTGHDAKLAYTMAEEGISNIKIFEKNGSDL